MLKSTVFTATLLLMAMPANATVLGLYGSECLQVEGLSAYKDLAFKGETLKQVQTVFVDQQCAIPAYDFVFEGPYSLDERAGLIDYSFESIKLTALTPSVAEHFNDFALCGVTSWEVGKPVSVAGLNCGGQLIPDLRGTVYDRISSGKNGIQMGQATDEADGSTPDQRPTSLDEVMYHAK